MATPVGLFTLAVLGGAWAYSRHQTKVQQRVDHDQINTGPTTEELPDVAPDGALTPGQVVASGDVDTKNWGVVVYRIVVNSDGLTYLATVRAPGAQGYESIKLLEGGARSFALPEDAEAFARAWILSGDEKPPTPAPTPPAPQPKPGPEPAPVPEPPPTGPTGIGTCVHNFYLRTPSKIAPAVLQLMGPAAQAFVEGYDFYLTPQAQMEIFTEAKQQMLGSNRSVRSLVARDVLQKLRPQCDWRRDPLSDDFIEQEYLTWESAWALVAAAAAQVGFRPGGDNPGGKLLWTPGSEGLLIGRQWLDLPEVGSMAIPIGRRVELLVGEFTESEQPRPVFMYPERVFARVIGTNNISGAPIVRILAQFANQDVTPRYTHAHGYKVGNDIELRTTAPTGVRRIYAEGVT
jgi:hypothetical protein